MAIPLTITIDGVAIATQPDPMNVHLAGPATISWGATSSWGHDQPGKCNIVIMSQQKWSPSTADGIKLVITATLASSTYTLFSGVITTVDRIYHPHRTIYKYENRVEAIDVIGLLERTMLSSSPWHCWQLPKDRLLSILDKIDTRLGSTAWTQAMRAQLGGFTGGPFPPWLTEQACAVRPRDVDNHSALGLLQVTAASAGGRVIAAPSGVALAPLPTGVPLTPPVQLSASDILLGAETSDPHAPTQMGVTSFSGYPQNVVGTSPQAYFRATKLTDTRGCWTFTGDKRPPVSATLETDVAGPDTQRYWLQPDGTAGAESTFTNDRPAVINKWISDFLVRCRDVVPPWRRENIEILPTVPDTAAIPLATLGARSTLTIELLDTLNNVVSTHAVVGGTLTLGVPRGLTLNLEPISVAATNSDPAWSDAAEATWPPQPATWATPQLINH